MHVFRMAGTVLPCRALSPVVESLKPGSFAESCDNAVGAANPEIEHVGRQLAGAIWSLRISKTEFPAIGHQYQSGTLLIRCASIRALDQMRSQFTGSLAPDNDEGTRKERLKRSRNSKTDRWATRCESIAAM